MALPINSIQAQQGLLFKGFCHVIKVVITKNQLLAIFGYILDLKLQEKTESLYIFGYLLELIIKIWLLRFFNFFSPLQNPFHMSKS
jgi:hypothetical protein